MQVKGPFERCATSFLCWERQLPGTTCSHNYTQKLQGRTSWCHVAGHISSSRGDWLTRHHSQKLIFVNDLYLLKKKRFCLHFDCNSWDTVSDGQIHLLRDVGRNISRSSLQKWLNRRVNNESFWQCPPWYWRHCWGPGYLLLRSSDNGNISTGHL